MIRGAAQPVIKLGFIAWNAPFAATLIGYTVSSLVLISSGWLRIRRQPNAFTTNTIRAFVLAGVSNGMAIMMMYSGLAQGSVTLVSPLIATYLLITLGLSLAMVSGTKAPPQLALGVAATVAGVVILLIG